MHYLRHAVQRKVQLLSYWRERGGRTDYGQLQRSELLKYKNKRLLSPAIYSLAIGSCFTGRNAIYSGPDPSVRLVLFPPESVSPHA